MESEKNDNTINDNGITSEKNIKKKKVREDFDQRKVDEKYYTQLYQDLPKEIVEILMETHPLMGKNPDDPEATAYRTRHTRIEDISEVKKVRSQQIASDLAHEIGENEKIPKRVKKGVENQESKNKSKDMANTLLEEEEEDLIQIVKVKPEGTVRKVKQNFESTENPKKRIKQEQHHSVPRRKKDYSAEDLDFGRMEKEANLDNLYRNEEYGEEELLSIPGGKKVILAGVVVAVLLFAFVVFKCVSLSGQLEKANAKIADNNDVTVKYEDLQLEKLALEEELKSYKNGTAPKEGDVTAPEPNKTEATKPEEKTGQTQTPVASGAYEMYTAQEGDTYWIMSKKFYGNGAYFTRILEANGLQESDPVKVGKEYKIPK